MSDDKILEFFKKGKREKAFSELYKLYPRIEKLILSRNGTKADANDVFQEALIILNRNLQKPDFKLTSSFYTYLYSVSRFVWKDTQKQFLKKELRHLESEQSTILDNVLEEQKFRLAEKAFRELGERCQQLLNWYYIKKKTFKTIAEIMQFKSENVAKNQKYKCLQKAKGIFRTQIKSIQS